MLAEARPAPSESVARNVRVENKPDSVPSGSWSVGVNCGTRSEEGGKSIRFSKSPKRRERESWRPRRRRRLAVVQGANLLTVNFYVVK